MNIMNRFPRTTAASAVAITLLLASCSSSDNDMSVDDDTQESGQSLPFALNFAATDGQEIVSCGDVIENLGIGGQNSAEFGDLRFYVSGLELLDGDGESIDYTLDENDFQYAEEAGQVSMIDLTDTSEGACADDGEESVSGTQRSNSQITGMASSDDIASVRFSVGVPQPLMQSIIGNNTAEGAPSPLNEMYWSWASGYRHYLMNFLISHTDGSTGSGHLHIGSRGCTGADGENALESQDECEFVNNPAVELTGFDTDSVIAVDISALLKDVDFLTTVLDTDTGEPVLDESGAVVTMAGVSCHSASVEAQPDCGPVFSNFGLDTNDGSADASLNSVFVLR